MTKEKIVRPYLPIIETSEELYNCKQLLTKIKVTLATMENAPNTTATLTDSLNTQVNESLIRIKAYVNWLKNQELIAYKAPYNENDADPIIQLTPKFHIYLEKLCSGIDTAKDDPKISSPIGYYSSFHSTTPAPPADVTAKDILSQKKK
jgi:hypothetical protein